MISEVLVDFIFLITYELEKLNWLALRRALQK